MNTYNTNAQKEHVFGKKINFRYLGIWVFILSHVTIAIKQSRTINFDITLQNMLLSEGNKLRKLLGDKENIVESSKLFLSIVYLKLDFASYSLCMVHLK